MLHEHEVPEVHLIGTQPVVLRVMVVINPTCDFPLDHYARSRVGDVRPRPKPPAELFVTCSDYRACVAISRGTEVNYAISDVPEVRDRRLPLSKSSVPSVLSGPGAQRPAHGRPGGQGGLSLIHISRLAGNPRTMSAQRPGTFPSAKNLFDARQCSASDKSTVPRTAETTVSAAFTGLIAGPAPRRQR